MQLYPASHAVASRARSVRFRAVCLAMAACTFVLLLGLGSETADAASGLAAVTASRLAIRASASEKARTLVTVVKGDIVRVLAAKGTWKKVSTSGGKTGWCLSRYLTGVRYSASPKLGTTSSLDWPSDYINLSQAFTYWRCMQDMNEIAAAYSPAARVETVGTTVMGNKINAIVLGNPEAKTRVLFQAAIHARESISALVALRQAECLLKSASVGGVYRGIKISDMLANVEIWVIPMANPDGIRLMYEGVKAVPATMPALAASIKKMNGGSTDFRRWKANAHGVDLNRNFTTGWKKDPNYTKPGPYNYPGAAPLTEPESVALRDLTVAKGFALTMSYHSSGEVIYWHNPKGGNSLNLYIANSLKKLSGYAVLSASAQAPNGGYRDWFAGQFVRPGYTMEVGTGYCPLPQSNFSTYWQDMRHVMTEFVWTASPKSLTGVGK